MKGNRDRFIFEFGAEEVKYKSVPVSSINEKGGEK
jgi:hypothetical protein